MPTEMLLSGGEWRGRTWEDHVEWRGIDWQGIALFALWWEVVYQMWKCAFSHGCGRWPKIGRMGASYATAFVNAVICSLAGAYIVSSLLHASNRARSLMLTDDLHAATTRVVIVSLQSFLGWLLADLVHVATHYPALGGADTVLHHLGFILLALVGYGMRIGPFAIGWLLLGEVSSLFLNVRWFLINTGRGDSAALKATNYTFAATFFACRIVSHSSSAAAARLPTCARAYCI